MKKLSFLALCIGIIGAAPSLRAQFSITPLTTFGGGDGWLAPGDGYPYLTANNTERGMAYGNGHLYLVSRANVSGSAVNVRILDPSSGSDIGALDTTGISGGTFVVNQVCVGGDGAIYVNNLTVQSTTSPLKVYKWATEGSAPTVAYDGDSGLAGARVGDSMAVVGTGSSTRLALGYGSNPSVTGNNGYTIIDPTADTATAVAFSGTPPGAGDFRLGITFSDASHVIGSQGGRYRYTSFSGNTGTFLAGPALPDSSDRLLAYAVVGGVPLLAVQRTSNSDSRVSIYDVTDPANPVLLGSANNIPPFIYSNVNGTGELAWGDIVGNTAHLWALSSDQGIQAFVVAAPPPSFSLSITINGSGTVSKSPDQTRYDSGTVVMLTATANPGRAFSGWSGDASGTNNPLSVTMTANKAITANFTNVPTTLGIDWFTIDGGGGTSTNSTLAVSGTIGQPDAGKLSGATLAIDGGFWGVIFAVQTPGAPTLTIAAAAPGQATISWTPNTPGFVLQETAALSPANWTNSPSGATNPIVVSATLPTKFYRLFKL